MDPTNPPPITWETDPEHEGWIVGSIPATEHNPGYRGVFRLTFIRPGRFSMTFTNPWNRERGTFHGTRKDLQNKAQVLLRGAWAAHCGRMNHLAEREAAPSS